MRTEVLLRKVVEIFLGGDGYLVGEDGAAVVFGGLRGDLVLHVAGDDGGVEAPDVHLEREVVAEDGNLVALGGFVDDGEGMSAGGALEVFEVIDGDSGAGRCLDHGGVPEGAAGVGRSGG